jgi:SAM-dependent methyltransferase
MSMTNHIKALIPRSYYPAARKLYWWLCAPLYMGNQVYCPCCETHFRRFRNSRPGGGNQCPHCYAHDRHRLLWLYLHNHTNLFSANLRILHIAPEPSMQKKLRACPNLDYTSADLHSPLAMVRIDITHIPYSENTVDVILCSHVLQEIPDDRKAMSEFYRILKPGGWALLQERLDLERAETFEAPNVADSEERCRLFGHAEYVRLYGRDFTDRLECVGFTVHQESYAHDLNPVLIQRYGLQEQLDTFCCTKPIKPQKPFALA